MDHAPLERRVSSGLSVLQPATVPTADVHAILIPGVGTSACAAWGLCQKPWLDFLEGLEFNVGLLQFEHTISPSDLVSWQVLLDAGGNLLAAIQEFRQQQLSPQPIVFICHGLGGVILKQALSIAGVHFGRYSSLLNVVAGVVYLGTPHRLEGVDISSFGQRILSILKLDLGFNINRQVLSRLRESASLLRDVAVRYDKTNLRVDTLSVYETKAAKIKDGVIIPKTKKMIIVDRDLCGIDSPLEIKMGLPLDHLELPLLLDHNGQPLNQIKEWLSSVIGGSLKNIENRMQRYNSKTVDEPSFEALTIHEIKTDLLVPPTTSSREAQASNAGSNSSAPEVDSLLEAFSPEQADPRIPCFMVDTFVRNKSFFGRHSVLQELDACLLPATDLVVSSQPERTRVALLCGLGGLGKTEAAVEYAHSRRDRFDAVFLIRADESSKVEKDLSQITVRLGIQDPADPHNTIVNKGLAMGWLTDPVKIRDAHTDSAVTVPASWLLIFDNADDPDILAPYKEIADKGAVLITSRNPLARRSFSRVTTQIDLQPFQPSEAGDFLQQLTDIRGHDTEARRIGSRLGGLPLAIAQMAGLIRLQFLSFDEFLDIYDEPLEEGEVHETELQPLRNTARGNISSIWAVEKLSAEARAVMEILAFLDPDRVQDSILTQHVTDLTGTPHFPRRKSAFYKARTELIRSSLVRRNEDAGEFWIHRVVQDAVKGKMDLKSKRQAFSNVVNLISSEWPASAIGSHDVELWEKSESLYPHIAALRDGYLKYFKEEDEKVHLRLASLLNRAAWYQHERGESHSVGHILQLALKICRTHKEADVVDLESDIRYSLGAVANETNDGSACLEHNKVFLNLRLEVLSKTGAVDERLPRAYNQLGTGWMMAAEYVNAEESFSNAATLYEQLPGYNKGMRSIPLANLGLAYWLQGRLDKASEVLELGLRDREELYGIMDTQSFRTGRFLHALGNVRFDQGLLHESEKLHANALAQYQSTIGIRHHRTADVCHKVAQHSLRNGKLEQALTLIEQALKVWLVDPEVYRQEIARTTFLKSKVLRQKGDSGAALSHMRDAAAIRGSIMGQDTKDDDELTEDDFDRLVTFWSR